MGRSYLTVAVCQAIAAAAAIAALRWLALYVEPETFGRYVLYQSVVSAAGLFLISWPNAALLRFGREEWIRQGRVGETFGARATLFIASASVALLLAWYFDPWLRSFLALDTSPWLWIALGVVVTPAAELAIYMSQAVGRTQMYGYSPMITRGGFLIGVLLIPIIQPSADWTYLAACLVISTAAAMTVAFGTMPSQSWKGFAVKSPAVITLVNYSWTLPFAGISTYVVNWVDSWVIRDILGVGSVGVYNWAYQTTAIAGLAFAPIAVLLTPRVIDARLANDSTRIRRYVDSILPAAVALAIVVAVALAFVSPVLQRFVGPAYAPAYPVILILLSALPFQLISYLITPVANAYEGLLPRIVLVSGVIAVVNVTGDYVLVPRIGIAGAAIATTTAFTVGALLLVMVVANVGIKFAPLWQYAIPSLILAPLVAILHLRGAKVGALFICALAGAGIVILASHYMFDRKRASHAGAFAAVAAFGRALTLSDSTRVALDAPGSDRR